MIRILTSTVAKWLAKEGVIADGKQNLYAYALYSFLFGLLPVIIAATFGILLNMVRESLLLIFPYMLLRKFSGGFHFKSARLCIICSIALVGASISIVKVISTRNLTTFFAICVAIFAISLCVNSPIESDARKLSEKEKTCYRIIVHILVGIVSIMYIILLAFYPMEYANSVGLGIIITGLLQTPCIIIKEKIHYHT